LRVALVGSHRVRAAIVSAVPTTARLVLALTFPIATVAAVVLAFAVLFFCVPVAKVVAAFAKAVTSTTPALELAARDFESFERRFRYKQAWLLALDLGSAQLITLFRRPRCQRVGIIHRH
jgi:hypothetical protein